MSSEFLAYDYPKFDAHPMQWSNDTEFEEMVISWGYETRPFLSLGHDFTFQLEIFKQTGKYRADVNIRSKYLAAITMGDEMEILLVSNTQDLLNLIKEYTPVAQLAINQIQFEDAERAKR